MNRTLISSSMRLCFTAAGIAVLISILIGSGAPIKESTKDTGTPVVSNMKMVITTELHEPEPEIVSQPSRYDGIKISDADLDTLARLVWIEARGEPFEGQVAVVEVVLNRVLSESFPDTVKEVVYQNNPVQFSLAACIPATTAEEVQYRAIEEAITSEEPITDTDVVYFSTTAQNDRIFARIGNHVFCRE